MKLITFWFEEFSKMKKKSNDFCLNLILHFLDIDLHNFKLQISNTGYKYLQFHSRVHSTSKDKI